MGPVRVVMLDVLGKDCFEVTAAEDEHPVEALAPDGADEALADGVRPRSLDRGLDDPDDVGGEDGVEGGGELGVAIEDEELDRVRPVGELHREVPGLLGDPAGDRVRRDAGDPHETRVVVDEHEDVEPAEENGVDMEEVARHRLSVMTEPGASDIVPVELPPDPPGLRPDAVAQQAAAHGGESQLRQTISDELDREITRSRDAGQVQYEQAVLWRRINLWIGLAVGALAAASGTTGLVAKDSIAAAVIAACATFGAGSLTALNASQRKVQASAAGGAYRELEAEARRLRYVELAFVPLGDALAKLQAITVRRMSLHKVAEPPSARAFRRADRNRQERLKYGKILDFGERHKTVFWIQTPNAAPNGVAPSAAEGEVPHVPHPVKLDI
jgi:hypothetical protein